MNRVSQGSQQSLMMQLLRDYPKLDCKGGCTAFQQRFKQAVHSSVYYKARSALRHEVSLRGMNGPEDLNGMQSTAAMGPEFGSLREPPPMQPEAAVAEGHGGVAAFVPTPLLDNVSAIKKACDSAGGLDVAQQLAEIIDRAGGTMNFLQAVELLRRIGKTD